MVAALSKRFGENEVRLIEPASASEDVSHFARAWDIPSVYWTVGGVDRETYAKAERAGRVNMIPSNHSPQFAPVIDPTLRVGVEAMLEAANIWLGN